eukprot:2047454-Prymnesium_polylepis.1
MGFEIRRGVDPKAVNGVLLVILQSLLPGCEPVNRNRYALVLHSRQRDTPHVRAIASPSRGRDSTCTRPHSLLPVW